MSHAATNWALKQRGLRPVEKLALIHLADCHNGQTGDCFPSQQMLADQCEVSRATMNRVLSSLEEAGLISRRQRVNSETKRQESTLYVLHLDRSNSVSQNETQDADPCLKNDESRVSKSDSSVSHSYETLTGKGTGKGTGNTREVPTELDLLSEEECPKTDPFDETMDRFYAIFPKRLDRKYSTPAEIKPRLRAALKKVSASELLRAAENYAASPDHKGGEYARKAAYWLRDEEWSKYLSAEPAPPSRYQQIIERARQSEIDAKANLARIEAQAERDRIKREKIAHLSPEEYLASIGFNLK